MAYQLSLSVPAVPKSLNKALRTNRWRSNSTNKAWDRHIWLLTRGKLPLEPLTKAKIKIIRHSYRTLDYDGLVGSMKPVVDALVTAGVLFSDSWNVLGIWDVTQQFRPKKLGSLLEIEIFSL